MTWSISIKRVGTGDTSTCSAKVASTATTAASVDPLQQLSSTNHTAITATTPSTTQEVSSAAVVVEKSAQQQPSTFVIQVNPDSPLSDLHSSIEAVTGLKADQQRLIYRGRILPGQSPDQTLLEDNNNPGMRICDVTGLNDGHTIHLFPKKSNNNSNDLLAPSAEAATTDNGISATAVLQDPANATASSLLSALFGMRSGFALGNNGNVTVISSSNNTGGNNNGDGLPEALASLAGLTNLSRRLSQQRAASNTAAATREHHRSTSASREQRTAAARAALTARTAAAASGAAPRVASRRQRGYRDGVPPIREPGSLETIRQSLMTLHTMLGSTSQQQENLGASSATIVRPNRKFFKGQWIDVKDTVNQWLEATVLEVATPEDVLGEDLHLLTEPIEVGSSVLPAPSVLPRGMLDGFPVVSTDDLEGRRSLLLRSVIVSSRDDVNATIHKTVEIPHDSYSSTQQLLLVHYNGWPHRWDEWIRSDSPRIRAFRTRTRHSSSLPFSAPSIHSIHADSPPTHIYSNDDELLERTAILPEVARILHDVQLHLTDVSGTSLGTSTSEEEQQTSSTIANEEEKEASDDEDGYYSSLTSEIQPRPHLPWHITDSVVCNTKAAASNRTGRAVSRSDVQMLAALFDRLGRTLTDLAPHVASLATTFPEDPTSHIPILGDATRGTDTDSSIPSTNEAEHADTPPPLIEVDQPAADINTTATAVPRPTQQQNENIDFASGLVHTRLSSSSSSSYVSGFNAGSQGARQNGRERAAAIAAFLSNSGASGNQSATSGTDGEGASNEVEDSSNVDSSSFPESLARLLAGGGNVDGGGIDIHIHAILTPGFSPGVGQPFGGLPGVELGTISATNQNMPAFESVTPSSTLPVQNEEDMGLFDDLYGEPLDMPALEDVPSSDDEMPPLEDISPSIINARNNPFSGIDLMDYDTIMQSDDRNNNNLEHDNGYLSLETHPDSEVLNGTDAIISSDQHAEEENNLGVIADVAAPSETQVDPEEETPPSGVDEPEDERRDLLSVIRRYTVGRGNR